MTATTTTALRCDAGTCREFVMARPRENDDELRRRAMQEHGWRYSVRGEVVQDHCRWHA